MSIIALFFPACISMVIRHKRNEKLTWNLAGCILEYAVLTIINVFLSQVVIVNILGITTDSTAFESFPFFTKYLFIASAAAFLVPYVEEVVSRYIKVSFSVGENEEKKGKGTKNV